MIEAAIITPVLLLFVFGIFEFGFAFGALRGQAGLAASY